MEACMKFPMFFKETTNKKYHEDPFRAVNFKTTVDGALLCPNGKKFKFVYRKNIQGNQYGRQEEIYECEDCNGCPYAERCKKTPHNRRISLNRELTKVHADVIGRLTDTRGFLLRRNRAIQAEGTFGVMKNDREYDRIVRRGMDSVKMEVFLVSIG
ncbi:transposase, partial [Acidaminococcus fermentans]|uniref:transposase n=1 Tax=Acidaminococcus fermentans TaxID=905 RepID=UPI003CFE8BF0